MRLLLISILALIFFISCGDKKDKVKEEAMNISSDSASR